MRPRLYSTAEDRAFAMLVRSPVTISEACHEALIINGLRKLCKRGIARFDMVSKAYFLKEMV